jgi:hypothetical protein
MTGAMKKTIDELANSLQTVTLLATKLRRQLAESAQEAIDLEAAADKAVRAIRQLRPRQGAKR